MWILALAPFIVGVAFALIAVVLLTAEFVGKGAIGALQVGWTAIKPSNHRRTAQ